MKHAFFISYCNFKQKMPVLHYKLYNILWWRPQRLPASLCSDGKFCDRWPQGESHVQHHQIAVRRCQGQKAPWRTTNLAKNAKSWQDFWFWVSCTRGSHTELFQHRLTHLRQQKLSKHNLSFSESFDFGLCSSPILEFDWCIECIVQSLWGGAGPSWPVTGPG